IQEDRLSQFGAQLQWSVSCQYHRVTYEAESPDEAAFVIAARELGLSSIKGYKQRYLSWS
ncbi:hypothetical protein Tco_0311124, partial [Tanacetum coccineum]